jgi:hypothetical protein
MVDRSARVADVVQMSCVSNGENKKMPFDHIQCLVIVVLAYRGPVACDSW